jgi:hypothetical protein
VNRINLDLKKLLGFRIVANQLTGIKSLKIGSKLGVKIGGGKGGPKPSSKNQ